jgi:hypothetical protein
MQIFFNQKCCPIFKNIPAPLKPIGELTQPMAFSTFFGSLLFHVHTAKQQSLIDLTCHEQHKHISLSYVLTTIAYLCSTHWVLSLSLSLSLSMT